MDLPRTQVNGFTLIELAIAMLIFLIGVVGLIQLTVAGVSIDRLAADQSIAASLAQMKTDQLTGAIWIGTNIPTSLATGGAIPSKPYSNPLATPNPSAVVNYVDYFDANGASTTASSQYYFVRQWRIQDCNDASCASSCGAPPCNTKKIDVVVTVLSRAFGRSYPAVAVTVYKSSIN